MGKKGKGKGTKPCKEYHAQGCIGPSVGKPCIRAGGFVACVTALVLAAASCTTLRDVIWPTTVKCLTAPASELVADVTRIVQEDGLSDIFGPKALAELEDLAKSYGPEAVICVLKELIDAYTAPTGMQAPPERLAAARRIQDFMIDRDIVVREKEQ